MRVFEPSIFTHAVAPIPRGLLVCALIVSILLSSLFGATATVYHVGDATTREHGTRVVAALLPALTDHHHDDRTSEASHNDFAPQQNIPDHPDHFVLLTKLFMYFASSTATLIAFVLAVASTFALLLRFIRLSNSVRRASADFGRSPLLSQSLIARLLRSNHALLN
jgi:hypothetical protein